MYVLVVVCTPYMLCVRAIYMYELVVVCTPYILCVHYICCVYVQLAACTCYNMYVKTNCAYVLHVCTWNLCACSTLHVNVLAACT